MDVPDALIVNNFPFATVLDLLTCAHEEAGSDRPPPQLDEETVLRMFSALISSSRPQRSAQPIAIQRYLYHRTVILGFGDSAAAQASLFILNRSCVRDLISAFFRRPSELFPSGQGFADTNGHIDRQGRPPPNGPQVTTPEPCAEACPLSELLFARILPRYPMRALIPRAERTVLIVSRPRMIWARCVLPRIRGFVGASLSEERVPPIVSELAALARCGGHIGEGALWPSNDEILVVHFADAVSAQQACLAFRKGGLDVRVLV